jgi:dipeptidyl aminopeptidase/acylaminoacyl peptidase
LGQPCQDAPDLCASASPITYAIGDAPPALLIHGTADDVVSCENSERMVAALQAAGARAIYLPVEGAQHSFIFKFQTAEAQVALNGIEDFLAEALSAD